MPVQRHHPVDLRKMYEKICMQKYRNFHLKISIKFSSSSLVTRLTTDVTNVQNAYMIVRVSQCGVR